MWGTFLDLSGGSSAPSFTWFGLWAWSRVSRHWGSAANAHPCFLLSGDVSCDVDYLILFGPDNISSFISVLKIIKPSSSVQPSLPGFQALSMGGGLRSPFPGYNLLSTCTWLMSYQCHSPQRDTFVLVFPMNKAMLHVFLPTQVSQGVWEGSAPCWCCPLQIVNIKAFTVSNRCSHPSLIQNRWNENSIWGRESWPIVNKISWVLSKHWRPNIFGFWQLTS